MSFVFQILHEFKVQVGEEEWAKFWSQCPPMLRERLTLQYNLWDYDVNNSMHAWVFLGFCSRLPLFSVDLLFLRLVPSFFLGIHGLFCVWHPTFLTIFLRRSPEFSWQEFSEAVLEVFSFSHILVVLRVSSVLEYS